MTEFVVHGVPGSPYVRTVLMALEEKDLPWRLQSVALGGNRTAAYHSIHPFQKIPTLDHGAFRLYETTAILNYLDREEPEPALTPDDIRRAARMDQVMSVVNAYVAPRVSGAVTFPLLVAPRLGLAADPRVARAAIPQACEVIDELARLLNDHDFMAGPTLSLADLMLAPHLSFLPDFEEGRTMLDGHHNLLAWIDRVKDRPSFAATEWERLLERFPMPAAA